MKSPNCYHTNGAQAIPAVWIGFSVCCVIKGQCQPCSASSSSGEMTTSILLGTRGAVSSLEGFPVDCKFGQFQPSSPATTRQGLVTSSNGHQVQSVAERRQYQVNGGVLQDVFLERVF